MPVGAVVLSGSVRVEGAQKILAPSSINTFVTLSFFAPDGAHVKKGQPILRINAGAAAAQVESLHNQIALAKATNAKTLAALKLKVIKARLALVDAVAARDTAKVDADLPKAVITGLQYDQYQGTYKSDVRDALLKQQDLDAAVTAVARQRKKGGLTLKQLQTKLDFNEGEVASATVYAKRDGTLVHGFNNLSICFSGSGCGGGDTRYRQGSTTLPGIEVGKVVSPGSRYSVRAWALQPDRRGLKVGQAVRVHFDALPRMDVGGRITAISAATQQRATWGAGRYYQVDVALDHADRKLPLLPGMSARAQTDPAADHKPSGQKLPATTLRMSGEIVAQKTWPLAPPRIPGLWQMRIAQMAPGGAVVKQGQPLVTFAATTLTQKLPATLSQLTEAKRALQQLRMQLADDAKTMQVTLAKAQGDATKAARKAHQPKQYIPGVQYKKLLIDRTRTQHALALTRDEVAVADASRAAQLAEAEAKVAQYAQQAARERHSMSLLTIKAPRKGLFLHKVESDGTQIDTGQQVFFGQIIGSMPDMDTLAVRASLPERDLQRVHAGQQASVVLAGGSGQTWTGHVSAVGRNVHSRSGAKPVPVVSLVVKLDGRPKGLKPGSPVSVAIAVPAEGGS